MSTSEAPSGVFLTFYGRTLTYFSPDLRVVGGAKSAPLSRTYRDMSENGGFADWSRLITSGPHTQRSTSEAPFGVSLML